MFLVPEAAERALWIAQNFRKFVNVGRLSEREKQVLSMVATGLSNADCCQSAKVGHFETREDYCYEEWQASSLRVLL